MEKETPQIVVKIIEFFNFWNNPDSEEEGNVSIKEFQLRIYDVSYDFVFKWYITEEELKEVSEFTKVPIKDNVLALTLGDHFLELSCKKESVCQLK